MMEEVEITTQHAVAIWWALFWRSILIALVGGFLFGICSGIVIAIFKAIIKPENIHSFMAYSLLIEVIIGLGIGIYISIRVIKHIIAHNKFNGFRIALISTNNSLY